MRRFFKYISLLFIAVNGVSAGCRASLPDTAITLVIELEAAPRSFSLRPAPLRYNKEFAWSFTLDDGYASAWLVAFPFFNGGKVAPAYRDQWGMDQGGDGKSYPGLFFTDGCGNKIPFRGAIAINGKSIVGGDSLPNAGHLSWDQVNTLYKAGWGIFNHGYTHAVGRGVETSSEIRRNQECVLENTGATMNQFVVPGGKDDTISEIPYTKDAFEQGLNAVHCGHFPGYWIPVAPKMSLTSLRAGRRFLSTKTLRVDSSAGAGDIDRILRGGKRPWFNVFTHSVGRDDLWGISLCFDDFRAFFDRLAKDYGQAGRDNGWFASYQAVQEYLQIRQGLIYSISKKGALLYVRIDTDKLSGVLRNKCQTFVLQAGQKIKKVSCKNCTVESYSKGGALQLINLVF